MIIAQYDSDFRPLSKRHESLIKTAEDTLSQYASGTPKHHSWAVIGTFGVGKTQFLFHLFRESLSRGLVPLLFLAEDLFSEIIREDRVFTQGDVAALVEGKISKVLELLRDDALSDEELRSSVGGVLGTKGSTEELLTALLAGVPHPLPANAKVVLLVDELEGYYKTLQQRVHTPNDPSPLRELLTDPKHLKFLALAPAGIYEMGNADQTRTLRLVIPAADVKYVRLNLISDPGQANACWWLSRGKARHLFKACDVLKEASSKPTAGQALRIIEQLDHIGQPPTEVPAAVIDGLPPTKLPALLSLSPKKDTQALCYQIPLDSLDEGAMAERLNEAFGLPTKASVLLAEYFKLTVLALSDANWFMPIPNNDLADFLCLCLDHLLEYEYGNPTVTKYMGEMLGLYERFRTDHGMSMESLHAPGRSSKRPKCCL